MEPFSLPSFAKINLHLRVLGKRDDGFHDICTVFQTISLRDTLTFSENDLLEFECDSASVPKGDDNLVVGAARVLGERFGTMRGARISIEKRIPSPGGLGGGSSNAAVALIGLSKLWGLNARQKELHEIAVELGSDVPFFLCGGTAIGSGTGTETRRIDGFNAKYILIVTPPIAVSTAEAYAALDTRNLTPDSPNHTLNVCRSDAEIIDLARASLMNDFENVVFDRYPEIFRVKVRLSNLGARQALLSGSGASVFGIFEKEETRQAAMKALDREVNWRKFAVATVSRDEYRDALKIA